MTQQFNNQRRDDNGADLVEHVVQIRRVAKVVKGGRNLTFNAMVVVGDGTGSVGAGLGKGKAVPDAVRKGTTIAKANMVAISLAGSTVPHAVTAHFGASRVVIKPGAPGTGVKAGGAVRAVMEAAGVRDIVTKALGSRNPINVVKAAIAGLQQMQRAEGEVDDAPRKAVLPPISPDRRGPLRREGGGGFRGRDRDRDRRGPGGPSRPPMGGPPRPPSDAPQPSPSATAVEDAPAAAPAAEPVAPPAVEPTTPPVVEPTTPPADDATGATNDG